MAKQYDAIVIGAGIGGLSAALLMASKGKHVLILEKLNDVGGRLTSHKKDGFTIDMGVHVISCTTKGPLGEILRRAGEESSIEYKKIRPVSSFDGNVFIFPHDLPKFGVSEDDMEALMKCMGAIRSISDEEVSSYDDITIEDYLSRYTDDPMIHACFLNISTIYTCLPSWKLSAGEFMRCMRAESTAKASGYPEGGCIAISHELEDAFKAKGGEVICTSPVEKIIIEDGRATGVVANGETYHASMIVSNADIQNTVFNLAGAENFSKGYVDYVKGLEYSWTGPVVRVATDEVVTDIKMLSQIGTLDQRAYYDQMMAGKMPEQMNLFLVSPSNFSPSCAPEGKQLINFATMVPIDVPQNISDELPEAMLATAERYIPNIREHIMWMESFSVKDIEKVFGEHGVGIGVAQVPGQVGAKRPKIKTEIEGLYIVGGEAGGSGVGTEMCMNSALEFADNYLD